MASVLDHRGIGSLSVSVIGLGCNNFGRRIDEAATRAVVDAALDAGINFFDTADLYGNGKSEEFLGRALGKRRNEVVVASKFGHPQAPDGGGAKPAHIRAALDRSLKRLGTDRIDLYQLHMPDTTVPISDTLGTLAALVHEGKIREIGCSNFSAAQLREAEAARIGAVRFVSVQNEFSLLHREPERDVLPECERLGIAFIPYYPLASGLLTGKYERGKPAPPGSRLATGRKELVNNENLREVERLTAEAESHGQTLLQYAFTWLLAHQAVASVIAGATTPEQVRANAAAGMK